MASDGKNKLVIFDLDETLIHSRVQKLEREPELALDPLVIYVRPHTEQFIKRVAEKFAVAVWSAGSPKYVEYIADKLIDDSIEPVFVWDRDQCTKKDSFFSFHELLTKDLNRVEEFGFDLSNTLIIEDDPVKIADFKDNAIIVKQYLGEEEDTELLRLAEYVESIDTVDDIRELDKNIWCFRSGTGN